MKENHEQVVESPFAPASNTLDGRNPAPPNIHETLQIMEALPYQPGWLAGFLNPLNHPTVFFSQPKKTSSTTPKKPQKNLGTAWIEMHRQLIVDQRLTGHQVHPTHRGETYGPFCECLLPKKGKPKPNRWFF